MLCDHLVCSGADNTNVFHKLIVTVCRDPRICGHYLTESSSIRYDAARVHSMSFRLARPGRGGSTRTMFGTSVPVTGTSWPGCCRSGPRATPRYAGRAGVRKPGTGPGPGRRCRSARPSPPPPRALRPARPARPARPGEPRGSAGPSGSSGSAGPASPAGPPGRGRRSPTCRPSGSSPGPGRLANGASPAPSRPTAARQPATLSGAANGSWLRRAPALPGVPGRAGSRGSGSDARKRVRNINRSGFTLPTHPGTTPETPTAESTCQESERVVV